MTPADTKRIQTRLGIAPDGNLGRVTLAALFFKMGAGPQRSRDLALGAAVHLATYEVLASPLRLAHFMGQTAHESGGFQYMEELGGATYFQRYEGRKDLGNVQPGDGALFHGRGVIQLTGRANYAAYGQALGIDLENNPVMVALPAIGMLTAARFWSDKGLNALADADDVLAITKSINGGTNGLDDRKARLGVAKGLIL